MSAGEERKLVTVLFADLVGSTAYAGDRDPERVRVQLERFYSAMRDEIERTGGTVEKFAGDAVMAVFGAPAALEDHAERALHAALAMQERLRELFGDELEMRVGVNTGEVVVGVAREGGSFVTGDVVNVCDRLQKAAESGQVLAGGRTALAVSGAFELGAARVVEAKGKAGGVVGVPVVRALQLARPRGVSGLRRVFVGRESELELLRALYRRATANAEPHLASIVGEPGVGKSRLVLELQEVLATEPQPPLVRTGRCLPYGDGITYWPVGEILREHLGLREGAAAEEVSRRLAGSEILGLVLGLDVAQDLHPLDARERLHAAVVAFVGELAADAPTLLVIEDIHWAEPDLLDLLERIVGEVRAPVVVLATARPELLDHRPAWGSGRRNSTALWLDPLGAAQATQMLEELVATALPDEVRQAVVERAEGNPFFLEELVGELVDRGALVRSEDGWSLAAGEPDFAIPDTVHAVLAARIDRLPASEKSGLQAASVVGRVFWRPPVLHLTLGEEPDFGLLEERDLITAHRGSAALDGDEFSFRHALTREVAYGSIPKARRGRLHAALADWLESGTAHDERAFLLAYHYSQAANPEEADLVWGDDAAGLARVRERAVHWLARAGELAKRRSEFDESIELLSRAVELCDDDHERAVLWKEIGLANALRFDGDAFWAAMEHALDGPIDDEERAELYSVLAFQTSNRSGMWGMRTVPEIVEAWVEQALELAAPDSEARARALIARVNMDPSGHAAEAELAGQLAERSGDLVLRSFALQVRGSAAQDAGRYAEAESLAEQRLALVPEIDDPDHLLDVYEACCPAFEMVGRLEEAREFAARHEQAAQPLSPHHRVHGVALFCEVEDAIGGWERIAARADEIVATIEANLETPCTRNARTQLLVAVAKRAVAGVDTSALEKRAVELAARGWTSGALASPGIRLALLGGDRAALESWLEEDVFRMHVYGPGVMTARLDALAALRDRARVEEVCPEYLEEGLFLEPFALRALGIVRGNDALLGRADELFAERRLDWHRSQTERLLAGL